MQECSVVVVDVETTGMSPGYGDRVIEIGAVRIEGDQPGERFSSLMNPGFPVSPFIESFTGIRNEELLDAPPCEEVMATFHRFIGQAPLVAHNARFDRAFLEAEFAGIDRSMENPMVCSMLLARRIFPEAPNHKLGDLARFLGIIHDGILHRALADAELTGRLWIAMRNRIRECFGLEHISVTLLRQLTGMPKSRIRRYLKQQARTWGTSGLPW